MNKKILAGNWKMNKTRAEADAFFSETLPHFMKQNARWIIAPSPTLMECSVKAVSNSGIEIFSQNCAWENSGAFTGEMSPTQLKDIGVTGTLIAHSERRQFFGETDENALKRCQSAIKEGLHVIFCVGENLKEREQGITDQVLKSQLSRLCKSFGGSKEIESLLSIAYEPVWAIGTGLTANSQQIADAHSVIFEELQTVNLRPSILYGGSVNPQNLGEISRIQNVGGALVGGASLKAPSYLDLSSALQ